MKSHHQFNYDHFIVKQNKKVDLSDFDTADTNGIKNKKAAQEALQSDIEALSEVQVLLWASAQKGVLILFQAMDAAGKDSTIKHVMSGVNPQGCAVTSFKAPSEEEKQHHFLWRPARFLPGKGHIAIFNRSYYEEVLVVKVHPKFLNGQWLPADFSEKHLDDFWKQRYKEINNWEQSLADHGITVIKFFLNVSKEEQKERFLDRLNQPEKNFKFSTADVEERVYWDDYQKAYEQMLSATSTKSAPWYVIPANNKWFTRSVVADIITSRIEALNLKIPTLSKAQLAELEKAKERLLSE